MFNEKMSESESELDCVSPDYSVNVAGGDNPSEAESDSVIAAGSLEVEATGGPNSTGLIPRGRPLYTRPTNDSDTDLSAKCDEEARLATVIKDPIKRRARLNRLNKRIEKLMALVSKETGARGIAFVAPMLTHRGACDRMYTITSPDVERTGLFVDKNLRVEFVRAIHNTRPNYQPSQTRGKARVCTHYDDPDQSTIVDVDLEMLEVIRRVGSHAESVIRRVKKHDPGITGESRVVKDRHT